MLPDNPIECGRTPQHLRLPYHDLGWGVAVNTAAPVVGLPPDLTGAQASVLRPRRRHTRSRASRGLRYRAGGHCLAMHPRQMFTCEGVSNGQATIAWPCTRDSGPFTRLALKATSGRPRPHRFRPSSGRRLSTWKQRRRLSLTPVSGASFGSSGAKSFGCSTPSQSSSWFPGRHILVIPGLAKLARGKAG